MNPNTTQCDSDRLESFLRGALPAEDEERLTAHLDQCAACRGTLQDLAGEPDSWREMTELLQPVSYDFRQAIDATRDDDFEAASQPPWHIRNVLEILVPSEDPRMLGRLGGYEVSGVVGAGGMGIVLKAFDKTLERSVAIKVLAPSLASCGAARQRFAREAKAAAAVLHPNVVAIHAVSSDASLPFLVMPFIRGASLQKRIDLHGPLPLADTLRIASQIAAGLAAAHAQGLVHRDIKPANVLLEDGVERVAITDFGLARAVDDATMTRSGVIAGTPQYMSPEQARGELIDQRSDLFSLGSVIYAMCAGRPPFRAETTFGVLRRITDDEVTPLQKVKSDVPKWLGRIVAKLMSKSPDDRFESAAEVAELLEACLAHVQQPTIVPLPEQLSAEKKKTSYPQKWRSRPATWIAFIGMCIAFVLGAIGWQFWQSTTAPEISGRWAGDGWGNIVLAKSGDGRYRGTFDDAPNRPSGTLELKWSRFEGRFNGVWREDDQRGGKLSIRLIDGSVRGAWTTDRKVDKDRQWPRLADLSWTRGHRDTAHRQLGEDQPQDAVLGLVLAPLTYDQLDELRSREVKGGLLIKATIPNSLAAAAGIRENDILLGVGSWQTIDLPGFEYALDRSRRSNQGATKFHLARKGELRFAEIDLGSSTEFSREAMVESAADPVDTMLAGGEANAWRPRKLEVNRIKSPEGFCEALKSIEDWYEFADDTADPFAPTPIADNSIQALVDLLDNDVDQVRYRAACALGKIGEYRTERRLPNHAEIVVPALIVQLADPHANVRWHAAEALGKFGNGGRSALAALRTAESVETNDVTREIMNLTIELLRKLPATTSLWHDDIGASIRNLQLNANRLEENARLHSRGSEQ